MAVLGKLGAAYVSNPDAPLTTFSQIALYPDKNHKKYTAPWDSRFWAEGETFLIERQTNGAGDWHDITSLCVFDYLRGRVSLASGGNHADKVRGSGKRTSVVKLAELLSVSLSMTKDKVESTNFDSGLNKEFLPAHKSWTAAVKRLFDANRAAWLIYASTIDTPIMFVLFTRDGIFKDNIAGLGHLDGFTADFDVKALKEEDLTISGTGGFYYETNAETTLRTELEAGASDTTVACVDNAKFPDAGTLFIEDEQIDYTSKSGTTPACTFAGCTRGAHDTTKALHAVGESIMVSTV